jgi:hypothetical protein
MSWMSKHATEHKKALLEYDPIDDKGSALLRQGAVETKLKSAVETQSSPLNKAYCAKSAGKSGCIKKVGSDWRVISNKTGKLWPAKYGSQSKAEGALKAYHS